MERVRNRAAFSLCQRSCNIPRTLMLRECGLCMTQKTYTRELEYVAETRIISKDYRELKCDLPGFPTSAFLMVFSPDGTKVASAHGNHNVYITEISTRKNIRILSGHPRTPWSIVFHPSSSHILASGCLGGQVRVWDLNGGCKVWNAECITVIASLAFHPSERLLVIATNNKILFWDWTQPEPFAVATTRTGNEKVRYVAFDSLGSKLITGIRNAEETQSQSDRPSMQQSHRTILRCPTELSDTFYHDTIPVSTLRDNTRRRTAPSTEHPLRTSASSGLSSIERNSFEAPNVSSNQDGVVPSGTDATREVAVNDNSSDNLERTDCFDERFRNGSNADELRRLRLRTLLHSLEFIHNSRMEMNSVIQSNAPRSGAQRTNVQDRGTRETEANDLPGNATSDATSSNSGAQNFEPSQSTRHHHPWNREVPRRSRTAGDSTESTSLSSYYSSLYRHSELLEVRLRLYRQAFREYSFVRRCISSNGSCENTPFGYMTHHDSCFQRERNLSDGTIGMLRWQFNVNLMSPFRSAVSTRNVQFSRNPPGAVTIEVRRNNFAACNGESSQNGVTAPEVDAERDPYADNNTSDNLRSAENYDDRLGDESNDDESQTGLGNFFQTDVCTDRVDSTESAQEESENGYWLLEEDSNMESKHKRSFRSVRDPELSRAERDRNAEGSRSIDCWQEFEMPNPSSNDTDQTLRQVGDSSETRETNDTANRPSTENRPVDSRHRAQEERNVENQSSNSRVPVSNNTSADESGEMEEEGFGGWRTRSTLQNSESGEATTLREGGQGHNRRVGNTEKLSSTRKEMVELQQVRKMLEDLQRQIRSLHVTIRVERQNDERFDGDVNAIPSTSTQDNFFDSDLQSETAKNFKKALLETYQRQNNETDDERFYDENQPSTSGRTTNLENVSSNGVPDAKTNSNTVESSTNLLLSDLLPSDSELEGLRSHGLPELLLAFYCNHMRRTNDAQQFNATNDHTYSNLTTNNNNNTTNNNNNNVQLPSISSLISNVGMNWNLPTTTMDESRLSTPPTFTDSVDSNSSSAETRELPTSTSSINVSNEHSSEENISNTSNSLDPSNVSSSNSVDNCESSNGGTRTESTSSNVRGRQQSSPEVRKYLKSHYYKKYEKFFGLHYTRRGARTQTASNSLYQNESVRKRWQMRSEFLQILVTVIVLKLKSLVQQQRLRTQDSNASRDADSDNQPESTRDGNKDPEMELSRRKIRVVARVILRVTVKHMTKFFEVNRPENGSHSNIPYEQINKMYVLLPLVLELTDLLLADLMATTRELESSQYGSFHSDLPLQNQMRPDTQRSDSADSSGLRTENHRPTNSSNSSPYPKRTFRNRKMYQPRYSKEVKRYVYNSLFRSGRRRQIASLVPPVRVPVPVRQVLHIPPVLHVPLARPVPLLPPISLIPSIRCSLSTYLRNSFLYNTGIVNSWRSGSRGSRGSDESSGQSSGSDDDDDIDLGGAAVEIYRVQAWDFSTGEIPDITDPEKNVVVPNCKITNDASIDISADGKLLVTVLPGFNAGPDVGVYSLQWETLGTRIYSMRTSEAIVSVSISPTQHHLLVGAARRSNKISACYVKAIIYELLDKKPEDEKKAPNDTSEKTDDHVFGLSNSYNSSFHEKRATVRKILFESHNRYESVNCIRWALQPAQGLVYATNTGQLNILH